MVTNPQYYRAAWSTLLTLGVLGTPFVTTESASAAAVRWTLENVFVTRTYCVISPFPGTNFCGPVDRALATGSFEYDAEKNKYLSFGFGVSSASINSGLSLSNTSYGSQFISATSVFQGPRGPIRSSGSLSFGAPLTNSPNPQRIPVTGAYFSVNNRAAGFPVELSYSGSSGSVVSQGIVPEPQPIPESRGVLGVLIGTALCWMMGKKSQVRLSLSQF